MMAQVGFGVTTSVAVQVLVHPKISFTVAVYVPALAACALGILIVELVTLRLVCVNPFGPLQIKV